RFFIVRWSEEWSGAGTLMLRATPVYSETSSNWLAVPIARQGLLIAHDRQRPPNRRRLRLKPRRRCRWRGRRQLGVRHRLDVVPEEKLHDPADALFGNRTQIVREITPSRMLSGDDFVGRKIGDPRRLAGDLLGRDTQHRF